MKLGVKRFSVRLNGVTYHVPSDNFIQEILNRGYSPEEEIEILQISNQLVEGLALIEGHPVHKEYKTLCRLLGHSWPQLLLSLARVGYYGCFYGHRQNHQQLYKDAVAGANILSSVLRDGPLIKQGKTPETYLKLYPERDIPNDEYRLASLDLDFYLEKVYHLASLDNLVGQQLIKIDSATKGYWLAELNRPREHWDLLNCKYCKKLFGVKSSRGKAPGYCCEQHRREHQKQIAPQKPSQKRRSKSEMLKENGFQKGKKGQCLDCGKAGIDLWDRPGEKAVCKKCAFEILSRISF
jgi:hypothetical protein